MCAGIMRFNNYRTPYSQSSWGSQEWKQNKKIICWLVFLSFFETFGTCMVQVSTPNYRSGITFMLLNLT